MLSATRRLALACVAVCGGSLALATPAGAGTYTVVQCHPTLSPGQGDAIAEQTSPGYLVSGDCSAVGLRAEESAAASAPDTYGRWTWRAPSGAVFTALQATASLVSSSGQEARLVGLTTAGLPTVFGAPGPAFEPADELAGEFTELQTELRCVAAAPCAGGGGASARVRDVFLTTDDRAMPSAAITGGTMFEGQAIRGRRTVSFTIADTGGGVREVALRVNDRPVFSDILSCQVVGDVATSLRPCAAQADPSVSAVTGDGPFFTGMNVISACGSDLALDGVANEACASREVFVDDLCPSSRVGAGAKLRARFSPGKRKAVVRSDQRARVRGTLTSDSGDGIGGATVCALTQVALDGGAYEVADTDTTRADGRYSLRLPPGPSRDVFVHRAFEDQVLARHGLKLASKVRPTFQISPTRNGGPVGRGGRLRFKGALPGPKCASRSVKVQAKVGKRRWQVFRSVRTNARCRYRTRFKLRETTTPTRFVFRARVPGQPGYPYKAGVSTVRARTAGGGG